MLEGFDMFQTYPSPMPKRNHVKLHIAWRHVNDIVGCVLFLIYNEKKSPKETK